MKSSMVEDLIDNRYNFENADSAFSFLKKEIEKQLPNFCLKEQRFSLYSSGGYYSKYGFFFLTYIYVNIEINIGCERGTILKEVKINDSIIRL